jgi:hypothetical protein
MAKALTVKGIEAIKPQAKRLEIADGGTGLYLIVQPSGAMPWSFRYRSPVDGRPKKFTIGAAPAIPLSEARDRASELARSVRLGIEPGEEKRAAKLKAADRARDVDALLDRLLSPMPKPRRLQRLD